MNKKLIAAALSAAMVSSVFAGNVTSVYADDAVETLEYLRRIA